MELRARQAELFMLRNPGSSKLPASFFYQKQKPALPCPGAEVGAGSVGSACCAGV